MGKYDRVIQVFPFRNLNTAWRRAMFVNHTALAPLPQAYPAWSLFVPVRRADDNYKRTWLGAEIVGELGGPIAEWRTFTALEPPERPCENVTVFYTPRASQAFAIRRDTPPEPLVGYHAVTGEPLYYGLDKGRTGVGGLDAERVVDCALCPPHPADANNDKPRQAWLSVTLRVSLESGRTHENTFDARPIDCASIVACCERPATPGGCLFVPGCPTAPYVDPLANRCALDIPTGCTWSNNRYYQWEFCGWEANIWWTGLLWCYPAQCQASLPDDVFVGAEFEISWSAWTAIDTTQLGANTGVLGFDPDCTCNTLDTNRYPSGAPDCKTHEGNQWGYVYVGEDVCRPVVSGPVRNTEHDLTECWGLNPKTQVNQCTAELMDHYTVSWSARPS